MGNHAHRSLWTSAESPQEKFWFLTDDDADFTALVVKSTGHHGADSVVHHRHDVGIVVLKQAEELKVQ